MKRFLTHPAIFTILLSTMTFVSAQEKDPVWHTRYKPAVIEAKKENKDLILVFTGSEWIDICKTFESDIISQPEFIDQVTKKFVLLKLEYPENNRLPKEYAMEYQLLKDAYRVHGFPTVLVTDHQGRPFGMNGYQPISADHYGKILLAMLKGKQIRDESKEKAKSLKGVEKAKALVNAIPSLPGTLSARYYAEEMRQLIASDPNNKTGKVDKFKKQLADVEYSTEMQKLAAEVQYGKMIELTDEYIRDQKLEGEHLQKALYNKLGIQQKQKNTTGVVQTLLEVVAVNPKSRLGKNAQKMLDSLRAQKIEETVGQ
ncbi:MAG: thioredoxin family protein [Verrucomicrobiales bacterium]|nr:thioredoxin family protein [Verrucomicrobiales bacterium]